MLNTIDKDHPNYELTIKIFKEFKDESLIWIVDRWADKNEPYRVCRRVNILRDYPDDKIKIYP